jgi:hypothetical protein
LTLDEYFAEILRVVDNYGLDFDAGSEMVKLRGHEARGRIRGRITLTERTSLHVSEQVEIRDGEAVRLSYAYYLVMDEIDVWGHDNDPGHNRAVHRHDRRHERRYPDVERTLGEMLEKGWTMAQDEDFWAYSDEATQEDA